MILSFVTAYWFILLKFKPNEAINLLSKYTNAFFYQNMKDFWQWVKGIFLRFNRANIPYQVTFNEDEVCHQPPIRSKQSIKWKDLQQVVIIKTEDGPELPDLWMALIGKRSYCLIPFSARGFKNVFMHVSRLKGFNKKKILKLKKINGHLKIICWSINSLKSTT